MKNHPPINQYMQLGHNHLLCAICIQFDNLTHCLTFDRWFDDSTGILVNLISIWFLAMITKELG